jgi:site-specific DNA recombinase
MVANGSSRGTGSCSRPIRMVRALAELMRAAIYARVSTERQEREQTIESPLVLLKAWVAEHGHTLMEECSYSDEGDSGSRLDRPGLDRLRDEARDGACELIAVLSPDRLARKDA